jgi:hypothetical protein
MKNQLDALQLADALEAGENFYAESSLWYDRKLSEAVGAAAEELRRLHQMNAQLLVALKELALEKGLTDNARAAIAMAKQA